MSDKYEQTELDKWLWYLYNRTPYQVTSSVSEAKEAIQSAIAEAMPEKQEQTCECSSIDCGDSYGPICYNAAINQFTTNLKAKGLLR